jgi:hypothetical protein
MRIAVLGWGSLVWDRRVLALADAFRPVGPILPLEFSRISIDKRLTLVIDENRGTPCTTYVAPSPYLDLDDAVENLRLREGMPGPDGVGFVDTHARTRSAPAWDRHPRVVITIEAWAMRHGYQAAIWTALGSNFHERDKANMPFSVEAALAYLATLDGDRLDKALQYFRKAPPEISCALREAVDRRWPSD